MADIRGVFEEVMCEHADFGLTPIENSVVGGVIDTLDALIELDVQICGGDQPGHPSQSARELPAGGRRAGLFQAGDFHPVSAVAQRDQPDP